jgi:SAM-dependent methyltransferase
MIDWKQESRRFDAVAELYDTFRPSYPPELVEHILSTCEITGEGRILEIGSGTGIATILFAQRGYSMLCIEPGENLAAVARQKLSHFPRVEFAITDFEDWEVQAGEFNLVICAQAFHWIPKETGYAKAAEALRANGHIALFWNMYPEPQEAIFQDLERVYQEYAPDLAELRVLSYEQLIQQREKDLAENGHFTQVEVKKFPWSARYTIPQYLGLLNTYSDHLRLPEENRKRLFDAIAQTIQNYGGTIEKPYMAVAYTAQKAGAGTNSS